MKAVDRITPTTEKSAHQRDLHVGTTNLFRNVLLERKRGWEVAMQCSAARLWAGMQQRKIPRTTQRSLKFEMALYWRPSKASLGKSKGCATFIEVNEDHTGTYLGSSSSGFILLGKMASTPQLAAVAHGHPRQLYPVLRCPTHARVHFEPHYGQKFYFQGYHLSRHIGC